MSLLRCARHPGETLIFRTAPREPCTSQQLRVKRPVSNQ